MASFLKLTNCFAFDDRLIQNVVRVKGWEDSLSLVVAMLILSFLGAEATDM